MDRRTIIFICGMTAIFFLMNQLFYQEKTAVDPSPISQPETEITITSKAQPTLLNEKERAEIGIFKIYDNIDLKGPYFYTFHQNLVFLGLEGNQKLPEYAYYVPKTLDEDSVGIQRIKLRVDAKKFGDPFLYSKYPLLKLEVPWVPSDGSFPIFLVYFENDKVYKINGSGLGFDELTIDSKPPKNALVFFEEGIEPAPYAVYNAETNKLQYLDHMPQFAEYSVLRYVADPETKKKYGKEAYYVLENEFMQLVFSNLNGALAEINLPFQSESHPNSVVRDIEFDRIIQENYPYNNTFPQRQYYISGEKDKLQKPKQGGYYPLLRRDILGTGATTHTSVNPHFYALNVFQEDEAPESQTYTLKRFEKDLIEFELAEGGRRVTKTFSLPKKPKNRPYTFDLKLKVEGDARHLFLSLGIPEVDLVSGSFLPTLKYRLLRNQKGTIESIKPPKTLVTFNHLMADWYCNGNGFFGVIVDPLNKTIPGLSVHPVSGELVPSRLTVIDAQFDRFPADKYPGYAMHTPVLSKPGVTNYRVFAGPFDKTILQTVDNSYIDPATGGSPDFVGVVSYHGWFAFISKPFAQFLFVIMNFFHSWTHSWGFSIILLTIVLRLLLYPLNSWSMKATAKAQRVAPKIKAVQEKYKNDPNRMRMEVMNLYKREGGNPFGGCLPMLIQLPFLLGMLDLLKSSFQLRGASFIPGWIDDLGYPDVLFSWSYPIPFVGTSFHLLPILLGVIMYFQQKIVSTGNLQTPSTDQQRQQRFMGNMMTIVFTIMFYKFPSGLNIYWISNMSLGILQQWWTTKKMSSKK